MNDKQQQFEQYANILESISNETGARRTLLSSCAIVMREAALGHARYEIVRCLKTRDFTDLCKRGLDGERFDDMVDELVKAKNELK